MTSPAGGLKPGCSLCVSELRWLQRCHLKTRTTRTVTVCQVDFPKCCSAAVYIGAFRGFEDSKIMSVLEWDGSLLSADTGATHSDFLMNSSTGLLSRKHLLMGRVSKQAALVIWDCRATTSLTRTFNFIKQKSLYFISSDCFLFVNKGHSDSLRSTTSLTLMLALI